MNRWKWLVILSAIASVGIVVATSFIPLPKLGIASMMHRNFQEMPGGSLYPLLDHNLRVISSISVFFSLGIVGILILFAIPGRIQRMTGLMPASSSKLLRLILLGLLVSILMLAASFFSALAITMFPLAILLFGVLFAAGLIGLVAVVFALGRSLTRRAGWSNLSPIVSYLLGLLILYGVAYIPVLGPLLFLTAIFMGMGSAIISKFGSGQAWNLNSLMEEE